MARFGPKLALTGLQAPKLTAPFAKVVDPVVTDPWLRSFLDLECFVLRQAPCMHGPYLWAVGLSAIAGSAYETFGAACPAERVARFCHVGMLACTATSTRVPL